MKKRTLLIFALAGQLCLLSAQQPVTQLSDGGTPWCFKFDQYDKEVVYETLPAVDNAALLEDNERHKNDKDRRFRFGFDHIVAYNLENSGSWKQLEDGDYIWRLGISSPGAISLSFSFQTVSLPEGCRLYVMNEDKSEFHGSFDDSYVSGDARMLSTEVVYGDKAVIELFVPGDLKDFVKLELWRVTHAYVDITDMAKSFGQSGNCENNARCPAYAAWDDQIRSVVCLVDGGEFCTGALINNTCNDGTPYVLTANHCYSNPSSWTFRFNWEASGCPNPGSSPSTTQSIAGGTLRARDSGSDFCLVQINSAVPSGYNAFWAGWNRTTTASTNPFCVHHPSGDIKKFSLTTGTSSMITISFNGDPSTDMWQTPTWTDGVTEPGSSGSPLFNQSGQIVGQLAGGPSDCSCEGNASCGYDYYGRFNVSWTGGGTNSSRLSNWLDPSACATGATSDNGYDPNAVTVAWDAQILSIGTPSGSYCNGNITPSLTLKNNGTNTITSITISYQIDGGGSTNFPWTGTLTSGSSTVVSMPAISVASGAHTYTATASTTINGSQTDLVPANNALTSNFNVASGTGTNLPFTEGFEGGTFPPTNWTNENPNNNVGEAVWERTTTCSGFGNSTACAMVDQFSPASTTAGQVDNLITPSLNLSSQSTPINLTFSVANVRYNGTLYDSLIVWISTDCGNSWSRLASYGNNTGANALATAADNTNSFTPTSGQWAQKTINLNSYASSTAAQIRFQLKSGWGNNTYIDDVNISGGGSSLEEVLANNLLIYPNPASDVINVENPLFDGSSYEIVLMNTLGEVLVATNSNTQKAMIDISSFASGSYLLKVRQNGVEVTKKIMIIR